MAARPHLIGIAGPSCAGKSELARWLAARLQAPVLNLDHYYVDRRGLPIEERARRNFDEPAALDYPLILEHVQLLAAGKSVRAPRYDFATHTRARDEALVEPGDYMILEGLFALYWPAVRALMRTRLFVAARRARARPVTRKRPLAIRNNRPANGPSARPADRGPRRPGSRGNRAHRLPRRARPRHPLTG
jgi:uridine kinase